MDRPTYFVVMTNELIKYGNWTLLSNEGRYSLCRCVCGTERRVVSYDLRSGKSKGCGCTRFERMTKARLQTVTKHGLSRSAPEYTIWIDMKRRCYQSQRTDYHRYGGRGITVCERWREDFSAFYADMGPRPEGYTLERRDNDGPYSPENCYWTPKIVQDNNKRTNRFIEFKGERMTVAEAERRFGFHRGCLLQRLNRGWSVEKAITTPTNARHL